MKAVLQERSRLWQQAYSDKAKSSDLSHLFQKIKFCWQDTHTQLIATNTI